MHHPFQQDHRMNRGGAGRGGMGHRGGNYQGQTRGGPNQGYHQGRGGQQ